MVSIYTMFLMLFHYSNYLIVSALFFFSSDEDSWILSFRVSQILIFAYDTYLLNFLSRYYLIVFSSASFLFIYFYLCLYFTKNFNKLVINLCHNRFLNVLCNIYGSDTFLCPGKIFVLSWVTQQSTWIIMIQMRIEVKAMISLFLDNILPPNSSVCKCINS